MSLARNLSGAFVPHPESRRSQGVLAAVNAELIHDVDGDSSAVIFINGTATFNATYVLEGSPDGTNYFNLLCFPYSPGSVGGTLPQPGQPLVTEAVNAATVQRMLCAAVGGLRRIRIRLSAYASGTATVTVNSDQCESLSPYVRDQKAATLMVSAVSAGAGSAATATLPAVVGLRHYIDGIQVTRSAASALTAAATPVSVTTTNVPGGPAFTFGQDAGGIGVDKTVQFDFGATGIAAIAANTATTVVCPAYAGVIWRINVSYRLGL